MTYVSVLGFAVGKKQASNALDNKYIYQLNNKQKYRQYCKENSQLPIFFYDWYLDAVCGPDHWEVALVINQNQDFLGIWPYVVQPLIGGMKTSRQPTLAPFLGIWLFYPPDLSSTRSRMRFENKVVANLVQQIPNFIYLKHNFTPAFDNWLPLYWEGFRQSSHYTYQLSLHHSIEEIEQKISRNKRRQIRKAKLHYSIIESDDLEALYQLNRQAFHKKNRRQPYAFETLQRLDKALLKHGSRKILLSHDQQNKVHAGAYLVHHQQKVYYLLGGTDTSAAYYPMSLVFWEAIKWSKTCSSIFDFEGSMDKGIERVFRSFGGEPRPFHIISKTSNRFVDIAYQLWKG